MKFRKQSKCLVIRTMAVRISESVASLNPEPAGTLVRMLFIMALLQNGGRAVEDGTYDKEILPKPILNLLHPTHTLAQKWNSGTRRHGRMPPKWTSSIER